MITTVSSSQQQILRDIMTLHNQGEMFHADVTYSTGAFWKGFDRKPAIRADLDPGLPDLTDPGVDVRDLSKVFKPGAIKSVVFDPPFIHAPGKESIIGKRFSGYPSQRALMAMYQDAAEQIHMVLAPKGLLIWKAQDIVESGKQVWNHMLIWAYCTMNPDPLYTLEDLFVLVNERRITGHNHGRQQHARKTHSYFMVFRKK